MAKRRPQNASQRVSGRESQLKTPPKPQPSPPVVAPQLPADGEIDVEELQPPKPVQNLTSVFARWLTVERLLWGLVVIIAAAVRLLDLAHFSLTDGEASLSNASFDLLRGIPESSLHVSPLAAGLNAYIFLIFGANDVTARIVAALSGVVPVIFTYRLRSTLGRWGAMVAALLFALSASYVHISRSANGEGLALAGMYVAIVGAWEYLSSGESRAMYLVAVGLAVGLTAGQSAYTILLIGVSFALITLILRRARAVETPEFDAAIANLKESPGALRNPVLAFIIVVLAGATAALLNPLGLQATLNVAAGWSTQWVQAANQSPSFYVEALISYELLPLAFGLAGLIVYLGRGERGALFLAWWLALGLTFYTLSPVKFAEALPVILVPLIWAAGRVIADMFAALARDFSLANEGVFVLVGLVTCGIFGINLSGYAQDGQTSHLAVDAIAVGMLILIGAMAGGFAVLYHPPASDGAEPQIGGDRFQANALTWRAALNRAVPVLGTISLAGLSVLFIGASMNLNFHDADDPHEPIIDAATTMEASSLKPMLEDLSNRWLGDPHVAPIAAESAIGPALHWYLRDFQSVRYFDSPPATASEPIVIVSAQSRQPGFADYASQRVRWRWLKPAEPVIGIAYLRWLLYRGLHDVPPSYDIIVYAQMK